MEPHSLSPIQEEADMELLVVQLFRVHFFMNKKFDQYVLIKTFTIGKYPARLSIPKR
jgi:hypothetical protein